MDKQKCIISNQAEFSNLKFCVLKKKLTLDSMILNELWPSYGIVFTAIKNWAQMCRTNSKFLKIWLGGPKFNRLGVAGAL